MSAPIQSSPFMKILRNVKRLYPNSSYLPRELNDEWNSVQKRPRNAKTEPYFGDAVKNFGMDLKKEYRNINLLNRFVNPMGQIKPRKLTGLSLLSQKKVAKAIRRARSMGMMPFTYRLRDV